MKLLLINNTIFYEADNAIYLNKETGVFFKKMQDLGNEVVTFQISQDRTNKDVFANFQISDKGIKIYRVKRKSRKLLSFFKSFFVIQKVVLKADFIYIYYPGPICMFIALCCFFYKKPYGLYVRGEQGILSKLSKLIIKRADIINTVSPKFTEELRKINSNVETIRPMIGFNEDDIIVNRAYKEKEEYRILFVGRLSLDKGVYELVDSLKILEAKGIKVKLRFVGPGPEFEKIKSLNIWNVELLGMVSDINYLKEIYHNSDVFVLPTYHEGFPRVLYEAMMMGIPILTTFVGTIGYLMRDGYNCYKIEVKSASSIAEKIGFLLNDFSKRSYIANNARKTVEEYLSNKKLSHAEQLNEYLKRQNEN